MLVLTTGGPTPINVQFSNGALVIRTGGNLVNCRIVDEANVTVAYYINGARLLPPAAALLVTGLIAANPALAGISAVAFLNSLPTAVETTPVP